MKPTIPKGTRDFLPEEAIRRKYLFGVIEEVFQKYGYAPIETPSMENLSTLTGKYGEEGERLLFKVLNNGDFLGKADTDALERRDSVKVLPSISKRGMRYDLTVPFARFVLMHRNDLQMPFKRYQIQPVWRADRPQKGRYQEFYQCDVDVVGSKSMVYDAEFALIANEVFQQFEIPVEVVINNRKILAGIADVAGATEHFSSMTRAIDKWDKIGEDGVRDELGDRGITKSAATEVVRLLNLPDVTTLAQALSGSQTGSEGIKEINEVFDLITAGAGPDHSCKFDPKLARGLDYYTSTIYEVKATSIQIGSLCGGGRYDDLTGVFGMPDLPGVGISFGAARIYDVLTELDIFPESLSTAPKILFSCLDGRSLAFTFGCLAKVRAAGVAADIYPEAAKLKKQLKYADKLRVPYVAIVGEEEHATEHLTLKDMKTGDQRQLSVEDLIAYLTSGA